MEKEVNYGVMFLKTGRESRIPSKGYMVMGRTSPGLYERIFTFQQERYQFLLITQQFVVF